MLICRNRHLQRNAAILAVAAAGLACGGGCTARFLSYISTERTGNVTVVFINNTSFRASFSFGSYDSLDRPDGTVTIQQLRLEGNTSSAAITLPCRRDVSIGTTEFVDRVRVTRGDRTANFDEDAFDTVVHFSSADASSPDAALPNAGTAAGIDRELGVDFSCVDTLFFTFEADPDAPGGFRIDFSLLQEAPQL